MKRSPTSSARRAPLPPRVAHLHAAAVALALFALVAPSGVFGQAVTVRIDTARSVLSYDGSHPLHGWTGTSEAVRGELSIDVDDPAQSSATVTVPVASFDSGNGNRDSNMLDVVESDRHPEVRFVAERVEVEAWNATPDGYKGRWVAHGPLTFHGVTHPVEVPLAVTVAGSQFEATANFEISLERFEVDRPGLMLMKIRDALALHGEIFATLPAGTAATDASTTPHQE